MSYCECQACERRREKGCDTTYPRVYVTSTGRELRLDTDDTVIASGSPEFIAAVARNL